MSEERLEMEAAEGAPQTEAGASEPVKAEDVYFAAPEAEENILRQMLLQGGVAEELADLLKPEDFANPDHGKLFRAMQGCVRRHVKCDLVNVDTAFSKWWPEDSGRLSQVMVRICGPANPYARADAENIREHAQVVKSLARRRDAIRAMEKLVTKLRDPRADVDDTLSEIEGAAGGQAEDEAHWATLDDVNLKAYEYIEGRANGKIRSVPTGIAALDRLTGGFFGGEYTIIAARPGTGKSAFALNAAMTAADMGYKVGIVSCEMTDVGFGQRTLSRGSWVSGDAMRKGHITNQDWERLATALTEMSGAKVEFLFRCNMIEDIARSVKRKVRRKEMDMLIVDYIGILDTRRAFKEDRQRIGHISARLQALAKETMIPIIALCQVNRDAHGQMPTMAQLRDSGSIEQDADCILFLHRPESAEDRSIDRRDVDSFEQMREAGMTYIAIGVAKNRNGSVGSVGVIFDAATMRYIEIMRKGEADGKAE